MAEDDDDEGFGDFKFAPSPSLNPTVHCNQPTTTPTINGPDFSIATTTNDVDWGDFIISGKLSHTPSLLSTTENPLKSSTNQNTKNNESDPTQPIRVNSVGSARWEKSRGALPLSIFGEEEAEEAAEEEKSGGGGPLFNNGGASGFFDNNNDNGNSNKVADFKRSNGINASDLPANLYKQNESKNGLSSVLHGSGSGTYGSVFVEKSNKIERDANSDLKWNWAHQNELDSNKNGSDSFSIGAGVDLVDGNEGINDDDEDYGGWEFKGAESKTFVEGEVSKANQLKTENGVMSNVSGVDSSWNALSLDFDSWNSNVNGINSSTNWFNMGPADENRELGDDDGWEFKSANAKSHVGDENSKDGQIKTENVSNLKLIGSSSGWDALHSYSSMLSSNFSVVNSDGKQLNSDLIEKNNDFVGADGWGFKSAESELQVRDGNLKGDRNTTENGPALNLNGPNSSSNVLTLDGSGMYLTSKAVDSDSRQVNSNSLDENSDFGGDDGWEFQAAVSEPMVGDGTTKGDKVSPENSKEGTYTFPFGNGVHGPGDLFGAAHGTSFKSGEWEFGFDFSTSPLTHNNIISDAYSKSKQNDTENRFHSSPMNEKFDSDENAQTFKDAFSDTKSQDKEEPKVAEVSPDVEAFALGGEIQGNKVSSDNHKGALPLSIFGDEEKEADDTVIYQDISTQMLISNPVDGIKKPNSDISINDLISSLYSHAEHNTSANCAQNLSEKGFGSTQILLASDVPNGNDDFDDDSWEFKHAFSGIESEDQTSVVGIGVSHAEYSTKTEINDYVDFFSKLKEELHFVALCHHENLKDLDDELHQDGQTYSEVHLEGCSPNNTHLNGFYEVLQEPKFQIFESEYQFSKKLSLVENDLRLANELLNHVASVLKILTLVSREEQSLYVSSWFKMLYACAQELKHGALIWKQALQKNIHDQILSKPQGKKYIVALGEVYRVVEVLGFSARLYKPWILASSTDPTGIFALLSECSSLWSSNGLEEALQIISDSASFEYDGSVKTLLESIKYVHDLEMLTLHDHVFSGQDPTCQLSALPAQTVPGMRTVVWNGQYYFLTLANLWANLISCDPPNLQRTHVG